MWGRSCLVQLEPPGHDCPGGSEAKINSLESNTINKAAERHEAESTGWSSDLTESFYCKHLVMERSAVEGLPG